MKHLSLLCIILEIAPFICFLFINLFFYCYTLSFPIPTPLPSKSILIKFNFPPRHRPTHWSRKTNKRVASTFFLTSLAFSSSLCRACLVTSTSISCCLSFSFSSSVLVLFSSTFSSSWCRRTDTSFATCRKRPRRTKTQCLVNVFVNARLTVVYLSPVVCDSRESRKHAGHWALMTTVDSAGLGLCFDTSESKMLM